MKQNTDHFAHGIELLLPKPTEPSGGHFTFPVGAEAAFALAQPHAPAPSAKTMQQPLCPISDWNAFADNFVLAADRYLKTRGNIFVLAEGENRGFNLVKAFKEIAFELEPEARKRKLALLACTIVSKSSDSTVLAEKILMCTGYSQNQMKQLGAFYFGDAADDAFAVIEERLLNSGAKLGDDVTFFANLGSVPWDNMEVRVDDAVEGYLKTLHKNQGQWRAKKFQSEIKQACGIQDEPARKKALALLICALTLHSGPTGLIRFFEEKTGLTKLICQDLQIEFNLTNFECKEKANSMEKEPKTQAKPTLSLFRPYRQAIPDCAVITDAVINAISEQLGRAITSVRSEEKTVAQNIKTEIDAIERPLDPVKKRRLAKLICVVCSNAGETDIPKLKKEISPLIEGVIDQIRKFYNFKEFEIKEKLAQLKRPTPPKSDSDFGIEMQIKN